MTLSTHIDALAQVHPGPHGPHWGGGPMGGATGTGAVGGSGWLVPLLLVVALVVLVAALAYAWTRTAGDDDGDADAAMRTLRERYAAGDVDDEEFERRRTTLSDSG